MLPISEDVKHSFMTPARGQISILNESLSQLQPVQIVVLAIVGVFAAKYILAITQYLLRLDAYEMKVKLFRLATYIPQV